mgnify:CR=1 FL=1
MTDEKNLERYTAIRESWLKRFVKTMNDDGDLQAGDDSGTAPFGTKIIFESYAEDEDENPIKSQLTFTMFVHKDSLTKKFKEHDSSQFAFGGVRHIRPKEECIINGFYDKKTDEAEVPTMIEDETERCTELDRNFVIDLICKIDERDKK